MSVFENAKYIKAQNKPSEYSLVDPIPFFRKEFLVENTGNARVFVQSQGFAKYFINGTDITNDLFISPFSDYQKILWYNEYDVTHLLKRGKNTVCVIAGNGFLNESFCTAWDFDKANWRDAPQFILRLTVDGQTVLVSDATWRCSREYSHIIYSHLRSGEYWDMRKKDVAWFNADFDDSDWGQAVEKTPVTENFCKTLCQPIREIECIPPKSVTRTKRGCLFDFGVNMSGYVKLCLCEPSGTEIRLFYTEEVDGNGEPKYNKLNDAYFYPESPFQHDKIIASGNTDTFKPHFCYHGFRYLLIEGLTNSPKEITAYFVHQDISLKSEFDSGNDVLNFIYTAGIRSTYSNMFWCLTDCPTREKMGWMNDAQASTEQVLINFDSLPLFEKWYEDILLSMFDDGSLHGTIPAPDWPWGHKCGPVCDGMLFELPYRVYLYTGIPDMLIKGITHFERYIKFLETKISEGYEFILDDWKSSSPHAVPKDMISRLYLLKAYDVTTLAHELTDTDVALWREKRDKCREDIKSRYIDSDGKCTIHEQTAVAMLLGMQMGTAALQDQLVSIVKKDNFTLKSGMVGIQYIYYALSDMGRGDIAYRLLTESRPGYRSWYESGATTLWEVWDGEDKNSHNHHMYSGVIAWFFRALLGITPCINAPGFEKIELRPSFVKELGFAKCSMETVRGKISAEWHYTGDGFAYTVKLPENVSASFKDIHLKEGVNEFYIKEEDL